MSRKCQITGRGPRVGNNVSHSHKVTKRRFEINLQKIRVLIDGRIRHIRVSTKAIKSGLITRPPITLRERKPKVVETETPVVVAAAITEETAGGFFSDMSVVDRVFQKKKRDQESEEESETDEFDEQAMFDRRNTEA